MPLQIRALSKDDAPACDAIVASLPYFFGDPAGIEECRSSVRTQEGWVATHEGTVIAFATVASSFPTSAEITWMAVHADHRRRGVGRVLMERVKREMTSRGHRVLHVLTLGPSEPEEVEDGYGGTRAFYEAMGFTPLRELELRSWSSGVGLMLALPLDHPSPAS
jgi:GNAT superfamily N-acetyltransferase